MAGKKRDKIKERDLKGWKYFELINDLLKPLHNAGCARDKAGNRQLHMDQYMALLLFHMFNPICRSMRALQEASELKKVQRVLKVPRTSLGSVSEAGRVFDSQLVKPIIADLVGRREPLKGDARLSDFDQVLTLVDGSWIKAVTKMTWALFRNDETHRSIKTHVQFELIKGVPVAADVTDAHTTEEQSLAKNLQAGRLYVLDRGYARYGLLQRIIDAESSFVCRLADNAVFEVVQERELDQDALEAGVVRDAVVHLGCSTTRGKLKGPVRIVQIECTPHRKPAKTARGGPEQGETILIVTDRLDLPADVIGLIYYRRWQVEIFFRFFKHILGCRHLPAQNRNGIELQTYAAIIACLLIALWTGKKPTLSTYRMLCWYFTGLASHQELMRHIDKLKDKDEDEDRGDLNLDPIYIY